MVREGEEVPRGIYDRSGTTIVLNIADFPPVKKVSCVCGNCRKCRQRMKWIAKRMKIKLECPLDEEKVDSEPLYDDLTDRMIERFKERGWD